ncbi:MAG TPA: hypothetical protein VHC97_19945 [Thermoanaerobaculia bacterium]|nr:hypothetical protein [Thermoanaerobaculia bacterium]
MARRTHRYILGWILLGCLGLAGSAAAASRDQWTPLGPDVSSVRALAVAPSGAVYAGTTVRGVFRSSDGAARWGPTSPIQGVPFVRELVIDPGNPRGVYALSFSGLFYSSNGRGAWQGLRLGLAAPYNAFAVAPSQPGSLYLYDGSFLQVSHDRGRNWEALRTPWNDILVLKVHPRDPDVLFAGLFDSRVWKSTDGGRSWRETQWAGPTQGFLSVTSLAFDSGNPSVMYAGTNSNGIWKSADAGETWKAVFPVAGAFDSVLALAVDPSQSGRIYAAVDRPISDDKPPTGEVWRSQDAGATWRKVFSVETPVFSLAVDPGNPRNVYAGYERNGTFKSEDRGTTWLSAHAGLKAFTVRDVAVNTHLPRSIWIAAPEASTYFEDRPGRFVYSGIFITNDGGTSWFSFDRGLDSSFAAERIVFDPVHPERTWTFGGGQFYRTGDGGIGEPPWRRIDALLGLTANAFAIDPFDPDRIFLAGSRREAEGDFPYPVPIVWRSLDGGDTWTELDGGFDLGREGIAREGRMTGLVLSPLRPGTVYAGGTFGFFRSRNAGDTWARISTDFPQPCAESSLTVDLYAPGTLYTIACDTRRPVFKSVDYGSHWQPTALALSNGFIQELVADWSRPGPLYAAGDGGVFVTDDRGAHWRPLNTGLPAGAQVPALAADPRVPGRLYAGTIGEGLFVLTRR